MSQFVPVKPNVKTLSVHMIAHVLMDTKSKLMKLVTRKGQVNESQTRDIASPVCSDRNSNFESAGALYETWFYCGDIDECQSETHSCDIELENCVNSEGTYHCFCKLGYRKDQG